MIDLNENVNPPGLMNNNRINYKGLRNMIKSQTIDNNYLNPNQNSSMRNILSRTRSKSKSLELKSQ